jgi:hypothetical protein
MQIEQQRQSTRHDVSASTSDRHATMTNGRTVAVPDVHAETQLCSAASTSGVMAAGTTVCSTARRRSSQ